MTKPDEHRTQWCPDCKRLADELAAARCRIAMLELLAASHEGDIYQLAGAIGVTDGRIGRQLRARFPSYDHLGHPTDYDPADLAALPEWPAAKQWLADRQEERDNPDHRDDAARHAWEEGR